MFDTPVHVRWPTAVVFAFIGNVYQATYVNIISCTYEPFHLVENTSVYGKGYRLLQCLCIIKMCHRGPIKSTPVALQCDSSVHNFCFSLSAPL